MRTVLAASVALMTSLSTPLWADVVVMTAGEVPVAAVDKPSKGTPMSIVVRQFGSPTKKYNAVGGGSPQRPPITRWDYPAFVVFFEHDHVVDAVVPGQPPAVQNIDELQSPTP